MIQIRSPSLTSRERKQNNGSLFLFLLPLVLKNLRPHTICCARSRKVIIVLGVLGRTLFFRPSISRSPTRSVCCKHSKQVLRYHPGALVPFGPLSATRVRQSWSGTFRSSGPLCCHPPIVRASTGITPFPVTLPETSCT